MKVLKLLIFILVVLFFLRSGVFLPRLKCEYVLSPTTGRENCDFNVKSNEYGIVSRLGKITQSFTIGNKIFFLYKFNTPKSIVSYWGVLSVDKNKPVKVSVSSNKIINYDPSWITFEETFKGEELRKYLNEKYFDCKECSVTKEVVVSGIWKDNVLAKIVFPNYINLAQINLYEK